MDLAIAMHGSSESRSQVREPRALTEEERALIGWMLRESSDGRFMEQLASARVVSGCDCGCASVNLEIDGYPPPTGRLRIIGDYLLGEGASLQGAFVFEQGGVVSGLEVCGYGTDALVRLPLPSALRPWKEGSSPHGSEHSIHDPWRWLRVGCRSILPWVGYFHESTGDAGA